MNTTLMVRFFHPDSGNRLGLQVEDQVFDLTAQVGSAAAWLQSSVGRVGEAVGEVMALAKTAEISFPAEIFARRPSAQHPHWLPPVDRQEVWAAGVTYQRSRIARQEEAVDGGDVYARVYNGARPEIFFKSTGARVVGPFGNVGIRSDATWNVPEPELGLVINPAMEIAGVVIGNDMSSRDIEGSNPLYLPQAKIYTASCSLGPGILLGEIGHDWPPVSIQIQIRREGQEVFSGQTDTGQLRRDPADLIDYLGRCLTFPDGVVLLTGTGVVPPDDFTLAGSDQITITIDSIGILENHVMVV